MKSRMFLSCVLLGALSARLWAENTDASRPSVSRTISADVRRESGPTNKMFEYCVGAGRANEGLRADWQRQLKYVHRECGFSYIRMHGLFTDDMGVYREARDGTPMYNWQYIDELYDYLLSIGMKPFVELGFMPNALASGTKNCFWWHGNVTQPKDWNKWSDFIRATVAHWTQRYGTEEVKSWYFEVWNEPNLDFFFAGTQADYFKLYETTARAIKAVDPLYRVGGPATAGCAWVPEFLAFCAKNHVPVDFVTTHTYGVDEGYVDTSTEDIGDTGEKKMKGTVLSANPQSIAADVWRVRHEIDASAFPGLPLHITEWSTSYTPVDPVHDSYHSAAFIVDRIKKVGAAAASLSYWVFTDIFEERGPRMEPFHGGFGLLNYEEIAKPSFFAFQLLNRLGPVQLACGDASSWVTKDEHGGVQVLFWDYTYTHPGKSVNNQEFYRRDLPPTKTIPAAVSLAGLHPGRYALRVYRIGYRINDPYATYRDLGAPSQLTREQVAYIKSVNNGRPTDEEIFTVGNDGKFSRDFTVRDNDVFLVTLSPL